MESGCIVARQRRECDLWIVNFWPCRRPAVEPVAREDSTSATAEISSDRFRLKLFFFPPRVLEFVGSRKIHVCAK